MQGKELLTSLETDEQLAERDAGGGWNTRRELTWWKTRRSIVVEAACFLAKESAGGKLAGIDQVERLLV